MAAIKSAAMPWHSIVVGAPIFCERVLISKLPSGSMPKNANTTKPITRPLIGGWASICMMAILVDMGVTDPIPTIKANGNASVRVCI